MKFPLKCVMNLLCFGMRTTSVCLYFQQNCRSLKSRDLRIRGQFRGHLVKSSLKYRLASEKTQFLSKEQRRKFAIIRSADAQHNPVIHSF